MRQCYLVSYDISDDTRLRLVHRTVRGWGDALQYSVFRCELTPRELAELRDALVRIIKPSADQVLIVDLGPADGRGGAVISALGRPYAPPERTAIVI